MIISADILEKTCKDMIETILCCLSDATKGTIYRVGPMPKLQVVRVTSGVREGGGDYIQWGLPELSDYNYPGKTWEQYRDRPGHVREAMGWCVESQKSWTADDPHRDDRSVRKQLLGEIEDFHHMEPVLVKKSYLYGPEGPVPDYPLDWQGKPIWQDSEYVVFAVIKIHFRAGTVRRGDRSTKIIKKLSRTLGTELLSLQIRETLAEAQRELSRQRMQSCNVLAHELRNTLIKLGFSLSAVNAELSFIREQWEIEMEKTFPHLESKRTLLDRLVGIIERGLPEVNGSRSLGKACWELMEEQREMARRALIPQLGQKWIVHKIRPRWQRLLTETDVWHDDREEVQKLLSQLEKVIWRGMDRGLIAEMHHLPEELRDNWSRFAYLEFTADKVCILEEVMEFLQHPGLDMPHKHQTRKVLGSLKALVEVIPEVEERANRIIYSLKNGTVLDRDCR